jgi:4-hydroxy-tetrahydrodipicolinate synthase
MTLAAKGVYCAAATPLNADLSPDLGLMVSHCRDLLDNGCHGISLLGSTGEANSFSIPERKAILEAVVKAGIAPETLLPGVGLPAFPDTIELTRHALSLGVTHVLMLPPFYYKGIADQGMIDAYSRIIDGVADDRLRIVLYHIPPIAQVPIPNAVIAALVARYPGIIIGVKDSSGDFEHMKSVVETFPDLALFAGADPLMLPILNLGGGGCITAVCNLMSRELRTVFDNFDKPEQAAAVEAAQAKIVAARSLANRYMQLPTVKTLLALRTGHDGWARVRPPMVALDAAERQSLLPDLQAL